MTKQDGERVIKIVNMFINDEMGNKLTKWNSTSFGQTVGSVLDEIIAKDEKEISSLKKEIQGVKDSNKK
jgi:hypothetical protein